MGAELIDGSGQDARATVARASCPEPSIGWQGARGIALDGDGVEPLSVRPFLMSNDWTLCFGLPGTVGSGRFQLVSRLQAAHTPVIHQFNESIV